MVANRGALALVSLLAAVGVAYLVRWWLLERARAQVGQTRRPRPSDLVVGFITNFLDTLGIGSFAPTTAWFKLRARMPDEEIFARAIHEGRVILTFDLDFARLVFDARAAFPSIVIYRLADPRAHHQIERLMAALRVAAVALESGAVVVVDDTRVRLRELPMT